MPEAVDILAVRRGIVTDFPFNRCVITRVDMAECHSGHHNSLEETMRLTKRLAKDTQYVSRKFKNHSMVLLTPLLPQFVMNTYTCNVLLHFLNWDDAWAFTWSVKTFERIYDSNGGEESRTTSSIMTIAGVTNIQTRS